MKLTSSNIGRTAFSAAKVESKALIKAGNRTIIEGAKEACHGMPKSARFIDNPLPQGHMWQRNSPLKNRTAEELHEMFTARKFIPKGKDPMNGYGGYLHPKSHRQYKMDPYHCGRYREPSHVDVKRPPKEKYQGPLEGTKKRFGYLDD